MGELKQKLATMSPEKRLYTLDTLPTHFGEAGQFQRLYRLLTDFDFIEAKLDAFGVLGRCPILYWYLLGQGRHP
ncbi:MAG: hypothetical protein RIG63_17010 [Coleofasciculus chthonoplastes F3-SA18-01]|uniref:hypothetical protein n=1 Tax=Coleofasciculus chthonoplastes TaxID=64178 RepID=UPI0032F2A68E